MTNRFLWLFVGFIIFVALLAVGLTLEPSKVPSPLIGKRAPDFSLPRLDNNQNFSPEEMQGQVWLLHVWATWCPSCRSEHPLLMELARRNPFPIIGMNYKEVRGDARLDADKLSLEDESALAVERAQAWLATHGDPYVLSALDISGQTSINYGVYGAPESYLIDRQGIIRHKHIGPLTEEVLNDTILPLAQKLANEGIAPAP
ncbi:MAG: DsbE family thiol:disulfide interchange protein [Betaproteobacteria bacterium]|nr:DsbE family thiol:disulfide interchange protein [Betaproteobacteria bacterium]